MLKRIAVVLVLGTLLAAIAAAVSFSAAPDALGADRVLCPDGARFVTEEGPTEILYPEGQHVAPIAMLCVGPDGSRSDARVMPALLLHFGVFTLFFTGILAWLVHRLVGLRAR